MLDYLITIETYHPGVEVTMDDCCDYSTINWGTETVISQAQLDNEYLGIYKNDKIIEFSAQAEADIVNGFQSAALGTMYWYDSAPEDQLNLIGSTTAGDDTYYSCRDTQAGTKTYRLHTHAQLVIVIQDGRDVKLNILQTFNTKKELIIASITTAEVDAITW